jgi:hypothetical protein
MSSSAPRMRLRSARLPDLVDQGDGTLVAIPPPASLPPSKPSPSSARLRVDRSSSPSPKSLSVVGSRPNKSGGSSRSRKRRGSSGKGGGGESSGEGGSESETGRLRASLRRARATAAAAKEGGGGKKVRFKRDRWERLDVLSMFCISSSDERSALTAFLARPCCSRHSLLPVLPAPSTLHLAPYKRSPITFLPTTSAASSSLSPSFPFALLRYYPFASSTLSLPFINRCPRTRISHLRSSPPAHDGGAGPADRRRAGGVCRGVHQVVTELGRTGWAGLTDRGAILSIICTPCS